MKGRIGAKEIWASVLVSLIGRLVFLDPVTFVNQPGQSAWMMPLIALPIGLFMLLLAKKLSAYGDPAACAQRVLGTGLGRAVIVLWGVWLTLLMAISVGKMISVTRYYFFPLTDISQTALLYVVPMCLIAFGGAVCIARSARLVWCIPFVALLVLVGANAEYGLEQRKPCHGRRAVAYGAGGADVFHCVLDGAVRMVLEP